jgi:hypothetical protein
MPAAPGRRAEMQRNLRFLALFLIAGLCLMLGLLFPQFLLTQVLLPASTVVWLLLRLFILSIDQEVYWWCLVAAVVMIAVVRLVPSLYGPLRAAAPRPAGDAADRWRSSILLSIRSRADNDTLRRDMAWLLAEMYSSHGGPAPYEIREELASGRIPLPPPVYAFLFPSPEPPAGPVARRVRSAALALRTWSDRRTGRDMTRYLRAVDDVLTFMETSLEMTHEHTTPRNSHLERDGRRVRGGRSRS